MRMTIAASIYVAIQTNGYADKMPEKVTKAAEAAGLSSDQIPQLIIAVKSGVSTALDDIPGMTSTIKAAVQAGVKRAYAESYSTVYLSSLAFGGIALFSIFFATKDMDNYFTAFLNKTVDAPHIEAEKRKEKNEGLEDYEQ